MGVCLSVQYIQRDVYVCMCAFMEDSDGAPSGLTRGKVSMTVTCEGEGVKAGQE